MKTRWMCLVVALCLMVTAAPFAYADTVVSETSFPWRNATLNPITNTISVYENGKYILVDRLGDTLSEAYQEMDRRGDVYRVFNGVSYGMINGYTGEVIVPCQYDYTDTVDYNSTNWLVGYKLVNSDDADSCDFKSTNLNTGKKTYYKIESSDLYFEGNKVGTLPRSQFSNNMYTAVYGDYLFCKLRMEDQYTVYDREFNAVKSDSSSEYTSVGTGVLHNGSGQMAFTEGCALTADEVGTSIWEKNNFFYDLQGKRLFVSPQPYDYVSIVDNKYASVRMSSSLNGAYSTLYGVIDMQGKEIIPCECDMIDSYSGLFAGGYQAVSKNGKLGYYNLAGEVTCPFIYAYNSATVRRCFSYLKDLTGGYIVLSCAIGELPMHFEDLYISPESVATCFVALDANKNIGVVDIYGNVIVPFDGTFVKYINYVTVSDDGSTILGRKAGGDYAVFLVEPGAHVAANVADDGNWTCSSCGSSENNGKFCTACGVKRASEEATTGKTCGNCGHTLPEGTEALFCPNCGNKL